MRQLLLKTTLFASLTLSFSAFADAPSLHGYGADLTQTSVSGLSSGGFMTAQIHTTYSGSFIGAGVVAAGPFYCSGSYPSNPNMTNAVGPCMMPLMESLAPDPKKLYAKAQEFFKAGLIDDPANLKDDKVYVFTGSSDSVVSPWVVAKTAEYYRVAGIPDANIKFVNSVNAGHSIITNNPSDVKCDLNKDPYINNCGFIQSHEILRQIYGNLNAPAEAGHLSGNIVAFNQKEFVNSKYSSMDNTAFAYVPKACETESCRVHIAFHGCLQGAEVIGDEYYTTTGYNEMADTNKIIVLYPQAEPSKGIPFNPQGCWDFWGYSSEDQNNLNFYTKDAPQMKAVMSMVKRLGEARK